MVSSNDLQIRIRQNGNDFSLILPTTEAYSVAWIDITILINIRHLKGSYRIECQQLR